MHTQACVRGYSLMHAYCTYTYMKIRHASVFTRLYMHIIHINTCIYAHTQACVRVCSLMHAYYTYTYMHIHAYTGMRPCLLALKNCASTSAVVRTILGELCAYVYYVYLCICMCMYVKTARRHQQW